MSQDPQKINVVVSGGSSTQVVTDTSNTINLTQQSQTVNVAESSTTTSVTGTPQTNINVGFLGVQGIPGTSTTAPSDSVDGEILFNRNGLVSGAKTFFYYPDADRIQVSGNNLLLSEDSSFVLSGDSVDENAFLIRDTNSSKNLFKIDKSNKRITFAEDAASNEYKVGIGNSDPNERVHITNGNLRVDGNMMISGHILPLASGEYNLGSPDFPFKELYLQGDSIVFVDKDAKITATNTGFSFQVTGVGGQYETLFEANTETVGVFAGDGAGLTGVPYSGLQDAGAFIQQSVASGVESVVVDYGKTLSYDPAVICSLSSPSSNNNTYFTTVEDITRTECKAVFSENISGDGFVLNCHISPINPVF